LALGILLCPVSPNPGIAWSGLQCPSSSRLRLVIEFFFWEVPIQKRGKPKGNRAVNTPNGLSKRDLGRMEKLEKSLFRSSDAMLLKYEKLKARQYEEQMSTCS
jgi:hypothetical protein